MGTGDPRKPKVKAKKVRAPSPFISGLRNMAFPMRAFKPRTVVGVDIGSGSVKAVKLAQKDGGYQVVGWAIRDAKQARRGEDGEVLRRTIRKTLSEIGGAGDHLAVNLSGPEARVHRFDLPDVPKKDLRKAVEWQVQKELGGDGAPVNVAYSPAEAASDMPDGLRRITAVSVRQASLDTLMDGLSESRVHSVGVTALSYGSLLGTIPEGKKSRGFAVVDVGGDGTWICIFRRRSMVYARRVGVAGNLFTQSLTQPVQTPEGPLRYSVEEAEAVKKEKVLNLVDPAGPGKTPDYFSVLVRPAVERLSAEVERTLVHFVNADSGEPIERVYLAGGGAMMRGLPEAMSSRLGLPVELLDLGQFPTAESSDGGPMGENALRLAAAIGAAIGWAGDVNLVPPSRRTTRSAALVQSVMFWLATILVISIPVLSGVTGLTAGRLAADLEQTRARSATVGPQQAQMTEINESRTRLESKQSLIALLPRGQTIAPQILKGLVERLPEGVILNSLQLDHGSGGLESETPNRQILLSGEIHGASAGLEATLLDFLLNMRESPFYDAPVVIRKERIYRGDKSALEFEIVCALN